MGTCTNAWKLNMFLNDQGVHEEINSEIKKFLGGVNSSMI
jgi:hypothetical protein